MKLVCLGDSITYGYGVPRHRCFAALAGAEAGCTLVNAGVNGDTTGGMLARLMRDVLAENPDALLLLGGTNDLLSGCPAGTIGSNTAAIVQQARHSGIRTLLGTLPPVYPAYMPEAWRAIGAFRAPEGEYAALRRWQKAFAAGFDTTLVDFYGVLAPLADAEPPSLFPDGIHPNARGHRAMADALLCALREGGREDER